MNLTKIIHEIQSQAKRKWSKELFGVPPSVGKDGKLKGAKPPEIEKLQKLLKITGRF